MPYKPQISDYEPLKRAGSSRIPKPDSDGDAANWSSLKPAEPTVDAGFAKPGTGAPLATSPSEVRSKNGTQMIGGTSEPPALPGRAGKSTDQRNVSKEHKKENWVLKHGHSVSYAGLFLFTALVYFRPYELSTSLSWLSSSAFWVAIATLAVFVVTQLGLEGNITARPREVNLALLLAVAGLLSIPMALDKLKAWMSFTDFLKVVLMFIVLVNVVRTEKRLTRLWLLVLIATCLLSVFAMNDYRVGQLTLDGVRVQGIIGGLFDNPNDLALHLVTMAPIALALALKTHNPFSKMIYLGCVLLITGGVIVTFSRGGLLGLMCAGGVLLWKLLPGLRIVVVAAVLVFGGILVLFAPGGYGGSQRVASASARLDDLKRSILITSRHPIVGVGMNNYIIYSDHGKATHNSYTQVASEMGLAAAAVYILFIIAPFKGLKKIEQESSGIKANRRYYYLAICLQASLAGYMVTSFFASVAYLWYIYYLVAYAVCLRRLYEGVSKHEVAPSPAIYRHLNESPRPA
jgi:O-antigen ligase